MPTPRTAPLATREPDHDPFDCECHETCSWCTAPVLDASLREQPDGARICRDCVRRHVTQRQVRAL